MENMKKRYLFLFLILGLVLIAGCNDAGKKVKTGTFFGGTDGISVSFVTVAPPSQFNQDDAVNVRVLLENKGEYEVIAGNAKAKLYGIPLQNFGLKDSYIGTKSVLIGKSEKSNLGGQQEIDFGKLQYKLPVINSEDFNLRARVCYPYETKGQINVCLKSLISKETGETVCNLEGGDKTAGKITKGSVSSAPIQITSLTEETRGSDQVRFNIKIENKGKGEVYSPDSSCEQIEDDNVRLNNRNKVQIEILNPIDVKCSFISGEESNKGIVNLNNNVGTISCFKKVEDAVEDKLTINVDYIYMDVTSKQITIYQGVKNR
ncbi:hypothetical protein J4214_03070 [Candidatus Woesearchaeota archaeon]|nr:hypothetical protein [Candidatus Woesearchaeota archaeon]